jgi:hypothetical protein
MLKEWPAMVSEADRAVPLLAAMVSSIVPLPVPLVRDGLTQGAGPDTLHEQPWSVVIDTCTVPPFCVT